MDMVKFWRLIEKAKQRSHGNCDEQAQVLQDLLSRMVAQEIVAFDKIFREMYVLTYRWDLWGAAYIINGGCSDDSFDYFRGWLIAQGETVFRKALDNPDSLAEVITIDDLDNAECEDLMYVATTAYEEKMERELRVFPPPASEPAGDRWEEDDLPSLLPRLWKRRVALEA